MNNLKSIQIKLIIIIILALVTSCDTCDNLFCDCKDPITKINTGNITSVTENSANVHGEIVSLSKNITEYGHCWNTSGYPTILDSKFSQNEKAKKGEFISYLTGLKENIKYYVRSYAIESSSAIYGNIVNFTTIEGQSKTLTSKTFRECWFCSETNLFIGQNTSLVCSFLNLKNKKNE